MDRTMLDYINSIPELVNKNLMDKTLTEKLREVYKKSNKDIVLVASGSSYNACISIKYLASELLSKKIEVYTPYTFKNYELRYHKDKFIVVISQGGRSTNCIDLVDVLNENDIKHVVITSDLNSEISNHSKEVFDYGIGIESVGYVTRGYIGLIIYFINFAMYLSENECIENFKKSLLVDVKNAHEIFDEIVRQSKELYNKDLKKMLSTKLVHIVSSGDSLGTAKESVLKICETTKIPSQSFEIEEYLHGPDIQLTPDYTVVIIDNLDETSSRSVELYNALNTLTERCYIIGKNFRDFKNSIDIDFKNKASRLIYYAVPFQLFSYYFTEKLNKWDMHPLRDEYEKMIVSKAKKK